MEAADLYRELVLEHNRAPRRFGRLEGATHAAEGDNPQCGDHLHCELRLAAGRVEDVRFSGEGCAITIAAASMLGEQLTGLDATGVAALAARFRALIGSEGPDKDAALGALNAMVALRRHVARHRCALLAFEAAEAAFAAPLESGRDA